jgi:hypothetical protein
VWHSGILRRSSLFPITGKVQYYPSRLVRTISEADAKNWAPRPDAAYLFEQAREKKPSELPSKLNLTVDVDSPGSARDTRIFFVNAGESDIRNLEKEAFESRVADLQTALARRDQALAEASQRESKLLEQCLQVSNIMTALRQSESERFMQLEQRTNESLAIKDGLIGLLEAKARSLECNLSEVKMQQHDLNTKAQLAVVISQKHAPGTAPKNAIEAKYLFDELISIQRDGLDDPRRLARLQETKLRISALVITSES